MDGLADLAVAIGMHGEIGRYTLPGQGVEGRKQAADSVRPGAHAGKIRKHVDHNGVGSRQMLSDSLVRQHAVELHIRMIDDAVDHHEIGHVGTRRDKQLAVLLGAAFAIDVEDFLSCSGLCGCDTREQAGFSAAFVCANDSNAG